jgi:antitoxin ParD1/3/4
VEPLVIHLPDILKSFIDQEVATGGYASSNAYIESLIEAARKQKEFEHVESLIQEGIDSSKAVPWTKQDGEDIRQALRERHARRNGNNP